MLILLAAGLIPAIYLMYYVYKKDQIEKEPVQLLLKIVGLGALSCFPAMILEMIGTYIMAYLPLDPSGIVYGLIMNIIVIGCSEEFVKRAAMKIPTYKSPEFNYTFDGVVYGVAAAMGFAGLENVLYIMDFGFSVAPIRAITAIPMHAICGVFVGFFYGQMKLAENLGDQAAAKSFWAKALWIPAVLHGIYDYAASSESTTLSIIWLVFVIALDIYAYRALKSMAAQDRHLNQYNGTNNINF